MINIEQSRNAVAITGNGTPEQKRAAWNVIGQTVIQLQKKHGIKKGGDRSEAVVKSYQADLEAHGLDAISDAVRSHASLFAKPENQEFFNRARTQLKDEKARNWSSPSMCMKIVRAYEKGGDEAVDAAVEKERNRSKKGAHERGDKAKASGTFEACAPFRDALNGIRSLPTDAERVAALEAIFGASGDHKQTVTSQGGGLYRVTKTQTEAGPTGSVAFDMTIVVREPEG